MSPDNQQAAAEEVRGPSPIVNVRFPRDDLELIREAARYQSLSFGSFVRQAAVIAARAALTDVRGVGQHSTAS